MHAVDQPAQAVGEGVGLAVGGGEVVHESQIELDPGYGQVTKQGDGGVSGAKVIDVDADTEAAQGGQRMSGGVWQVQDRGLGDLDDDPTGLDLVTRECVSEQAVPVGSSQLDGRDVDADRAGQVRTPGEHGTCLLQDLGADGGDESAVLCDVEEVGGTE